MTATAGEDVAPRALGRLVTSLAGWTALGVAILYAYGALLVATELYGAEQDVSDTLSLFPIEQLLLAGISPSLTLGGAGLVLIALVLVLNDVGRFVEEVRGTASSTRGDGTALLWVAGGSFVVVLLTTLLFGSVSEFIATAAGVITAFYGAARHILSVERAVIGAALAYAVFLLLSNFIEPAPLPNIAVATEDGRVISGKLITTREARWYVATGERTFRSLTDDEIEWVRVESCQRATASVYEQVVGKKFLGLPLGATGESCGPSSTSPRRD